MRIQSAEIEMSAHREAERQIRTEIQATRAFSAVLAEQAATQEEAAGRREKLARMLEQLIEAVLAALQGRKCRCSTATTPPLSDAATTPREREVSWRIDTGIFERESEQTRVEGSGQIRTADGRCIAFELCIDMQREYEREVHTSAEGKTVLRNPLVLNFPGMAAELDERCISFDLDADGCREQLPGLKSGSAYLVLDRNGNGRADDGSELFGVRSGDGFADLRRLDGDANGWIDEADPAFAELRLWRAQGDGGELTALAEAGVGALWLGSVASPFALKDSGNRLLGEIRATGLWLAENGQVATLQQVDLAVQTRDQAS